MVSQISSLLRFPLAIGLALLMFLAPGDGISVRAADFTVNSAADAVDASPGDGVCDDGAGNCTLRAAIQEANALAGADTITLPAGTYAVTIEGGGESNAATGDLDITDDLTLTGAGADTTIIGSDGGNDRVFEIVSGSASISGVTIQGGEGDVGFGCECGGGILVGAATTLTLTDSTVTSNTATGGITHTGGGIHNDGTLSLSNTTVSDNLARGEDSAVFGVGVGGGIFNSAGSTLTVTNSTVSGNTVTGFGGGGGIDNEGTLTINGSAVSDNTTIVNVGAISNSGGSVTLKNTIVANNFPADCGNPTSAGHNMDSDGTCSLVGPGDLSNVDPKLGPLADNGGRTQTHALLAGSPAIDAGDDTTCPASDQRGEARPVDGDGDGSAVCDIGAYEAPVGTTPALSADQLPAGGGEPASGGGGRTLTIVLLAAVALGLAVAGGSLVGVSRRY